MGLSIKEQCHEDWTKMTSTERGAFCQKCAIDVIDFTDKSPVEIKSLLSKEFKSEGRTCGRITNYQLDQINDEFFQWKSDQESFHAVWMFSLIAVFGLTLFSCQNNLSKEMVNNLNTETIALMEKSDSTELELIDETTEDTTHVAVPSTTFNDSLFVFGDDIGSIIHPEIWMGIMPLDIITTPIDWEICVEELGTMVLMGDFNLPTEVKEPTLLEKISPMDYAVTNAPSPINPSHEYSPGPQSNSTQLNAVISGGTKVFDAFIHPNPIHVTSRLYIQTRDLIDLKITVHKTQTPEHVYRSGKATLATGNHEMNIKFHVYDSGTYFVDLICEQQHSRLEFEV